jgi:hypothetical protein
MSDFDLLKPVKKLKICFLTFFIMHFRPSPPPGRRGRFRQTSRIHSDPLPPITLPVTKSVVEQHDSVVGLLDFRAAGLDSVTARSDSAAARFDSTTAGLDFDDGEAGCGKLQLNDARSD